MVQQSANTNLTYQKWIRPRTKNPDFPAFDHKYIDGLDGPKRNSRGFFYESPHDDHLEMIQEEDPEMDATPEVISYKKNS